MPQKQRETPTDAFFERLLSQQHPHTPGRDSSVCQAQLLCGRWLTLRRLCLGLSCEGLAEKTGLAAEALAFVEQGLADAALVPDARIACLCRMLSASYHDDAWVAMVLVIALGRVQAPSERVIRRVAADLDDERRVPKRM